MHGVARTVMEELKQFRRMPYWKQFGLATVLVILTAVIRHLTFEINPFVVYLPALVLIIFAFRAPVAYYSALLSAIIALHYFVIPLWQIENLSGEWIAIVVIYCCTKFLMAHLADALHKAYTDLDLIIGELNHRVKNTMAVVQSVVSQSARQSKDVQTFRDVLTERLGALSKTQTLLIETRWQPVSLRHIVEAQIKHYNTDDGQCSIDGEHLAVNTSSTTTLGMIFHELLTNAIKYGAFSPEYQGSVHVSWETKDGLLSVIWQETGGPPVERPTRRGFGTQLLERLVSGLGGDLRMDFTPTGLVARVQVPLASVGAVSGNSAVDAQRIIQTTSPN